jgi:hypothetical protein
MQKYLPQFTYFFLAAVCIGFWKSGYLFLLDDLLYIQNFSRVAEKFTQLNGGMMYAMIALLNKILPGWIVQRGIFIGVLYGMGIGGYRLFQQVSQHSLWAHFAGIFLMINPWVYARMLDGQWYVVLGVMMVLRGMISLYRWKSTGHRKYIWAAWLCMMMAPRASPHTIFFIVAVVWLASLFLKPSTISYTRHIYMLSTISILLFLGNLHWIYPLMSGSSQTDISVVEKIDQSHFQAFSTNAGNTNVYLSSLGGFWFWGEREGRFMTIQATHEQARLIIFGMIFVLIVCGIYMLWKQKSWNVLGFFASLGLVSYVLGIGISWDTIFAPITQWMYAHIPLYVGLREPQKWIGILMIVYAVLGGLWVDALVRRQFSSDEWTDRAMRWFLLLLPVMYTPFLLFAGRWQLKPSDYPRDWYDLKKTIDMPTSCNRNQKSCYDILILPWHMYQSFTFTHSPIAHPMANFFEQQKTLVGDNMEMGAIYTQSIRPESKTIESYIWPQGYRFDPLLDTIFTKEQLEQQFISDLKNLGTHSILLLKEVDWKKYQPHLESMVENGMLRKEKETETYIHFQVTGNR